MDLDKHLIREVKSHPVLYDSNHSKYKDIDFKQQTWIEIGRKLIGIEDAATSGMYEYFILKFQFFSLEIMPCSCS